jgi:hypothetical protein
MILPVPCKDASAENCGIRVYDLARCADVLRTLDTLFKEEVEVPRIGGALRSFGGARQQLEVHRSGSYRFSVVPALIDFWRLQHEVFGVDPSDMSMTNIRAAASSYLHVTSTVQLELEGLLLKSRTTGTTPSYLWAAWTNR